MNHETLDAYNKPFHSTIFQNLVHLHLQKALLMKMKIFYTSSIYTFGCDKYKFQKIDGVSVNYILHLHCFTWQKYMCVYIYPLHMDWTRNYAHNTMLFKGAYKIH
jgi:hypothetical protein